MKLTSRRQIYGGEPDPMEPTMPLTVTLQAQQWSTVLNMLAEGSVRVMLPLIQEIQRQLMQQQGDGVSQLVRGNGEARPDGV